MAMADEEEEEEEEQKLTKCLTAPIGKQKGRDARRDIRAAALHHISPTERGRGCVKE